MFVSGCFKDMVKSLTSSWTSRIVESASHRFMEPQTAESSLSNAEYWVQFMQHDKGLDVYAGLDQCDSD